MRIKLLTAFLLLTFSTLRSQNTFQKTYGKVPHDFAYDVQKTSDGGYIVSGATNSFGGPNYLLLFKTNSDGDTLWMRGYPTNSIILGYSLCQTTDGGYAVAGSLGVIKTDANGNVVWGFSSNGVGFNSIQQTTDGGYIVAGGVGTSGGSNGIDIYIIKLNANGIKQWSRKLGGGLDDVSTCVRQTNDGGYLSLGYTNSFGAGGTDIYLVKLNSAGDTLWTSTYGGANPDGGSSAKQNIEKTPDGGYIISAYTSSFGAGSNDGYLLKIDSIGNLLWSKTYGGLLSDIIYSVKPTHDGGYIFAGTTSSFGAGGSDIYLVKTNSLGDTLWTRTFGGINTDIAESVVETNDKGFLIAGYTKSFGSGNNDAILIKTDSLGNSGCNQFTTSTTVIPAPTIANPTSISKIFITLNINSLLPGSNRGGNFTTVCALNEIQLQEKQNTLLTVFPNPNSGKFTVSLNKNYSGNMKVSICNILGEIIYNAALENNTSIDLSGFSNGIYVLKAVTDQVFNKQIILNK